MFFQMLIVAALIEFMEIQKTTSNIPLEHAKNIKDILSSLKSLCKNEVQVFHDPKAKALLETSSDVLGGLEKAFHDFISKEEEAWIEEVDPVFQKSSDPWD